MIEGDQNIAAIFQNRYKKTALELFFLTQEISKK